MYNMTMVLAAAALGFDIRLLSQKNPQHPALAEDLNSTPTRKRETFKGRDAYRSAVKDNFLEPSEVDVLFTNAGGAHNTFHGVQTRYRQSVNFDVPMRFSDTASSRTGSYQSYSEQQNNDKYSDNLTTPSSTTGSASPYKSPSTCDDLALISLSPSQDKAFIQRQLSQSDTSSSVFETPLATPRTTPQRLVKFEDNMHQTSPGYSHQTSSYSLSQHRSPSATSSTSYDVYTRYVTPDDDAISAHALPAPPQTTRRQSNHDLQYTPHGTPERPGTLDIIPRPRPQPILKKNSSPIYVSGRRSRTTPTPSDASMTGDDMSYQSARSAPSPGSTPPKICHLTTLLDIDVEGQNTDTTKPIPYVQQNSTVVTPTAADLQQSFCR